MKAKTYSRKTRQQPKRAAKSPTVAFRLTAALERIADALTPGSINVPVSRKTLVTQRFTKVNAEGWAIGDSTKDWEGVYDASTGLIWGRKVLPGEHNWKDAMKLANASTLCGEPARAPTIQERLSIVDYGRSEPAIDTNYFANDGYIWEWTSTAAGSPSGCAWGVYLGSGSSNRYAQSNGICVRAVRAGQPLGLGL